MYRDNHGSVIIISRHNCDYNSIIIMIGGGYEKVQKRLKKMTIVFTWRLPIHSVKL